MKRNVINSVVCGCLILVFLTRLSHLTAQTYSDACTGLESIRAEDIHAHVQFLASDELEGRDTGSRGLRLASLYIRSQYERAGINPGGIHDRYFQPFKLRSLEKLTDETFAELKDTLVSATYTKRYMLKEDYIPFAYTGNMKVNAEVAWVGYGITAPEFQFDEYENIDARGKLVLMMTHVPREKDKCCAFVRNGNDKRLGDFRAKLTNAAEHGALGVLLVTDPNNYDPSASNWRKRHDLAPRGSRWPNLSPSGQQPRELLILPQDAQPMVVIHISTGIAADLLAGTGKTLNQYQTDIDSTLQPQSMEIPNKMFSVQTSYEYSTKETKNVLGIIEGTNPLLKDEWVVFVAHYDHIGKKGNDVYNGADDNASGTAALLEIAEAFSINPVKPRRSVLFLNVSGEEKGLLGSLYYVSHPEYPLEKSAVCINLDMISRNHPDSIYVIGADFLSTDLARIISTANTKVGLLLGDNFNRIDDPNQFFYRSDHYSFVRHGIPSVFLFSGTHEDYHKTTDTVEKINSEKAAQVAKLAFLTGWELANRIEPLRRDGVLSH